MAYNKLILIVLITLLLTTQCVLACNYDEKLGTYTSDKDCAELKIQNKDFTELSKDDTSYIEGNWGSLSSDDKKAILAAAQQNKLSLSVDGSGSKFDYKGKSFDMKEGKLSFKDGEVTPEGTFNYDGKDYQRVKCDSFGIGKVNCPSVGGMQSTTSETSKPGAGTTKPEPGPTQPGSQDTLQPETTAAEPDAKPPQPHEQPQREQQPLPPFTLRNAADVSISDNHLYAERAGEVTVHNSQFMNVQGLTIDGELTCIRNGDVVIDSKNRYLDVVDSCFEFDGEKMRRAMVRSGSSDVAHLIEDTYIVAEEGAEFDIDFTESGMKINTSGVLSINSLTENITVDNSSTEVEYDFSKGVECVTLGNGSRYTYKGNGTNSLFALYVPSRAKEFRLCLRKAPEDSFTAEHEQQGVIDFVDGNATLLGIYEYEKLDRLNRFTDIIAAEHSNATMQYSENMRYAELMHSTADSHFYSGAFDILYDGTYHYRFFDYTKPYSLVSVEPYIIIKDKTLIRNNSDTVWVLVSSDSAYYDEYYDGLARWFITPFCNALHNGFAAHYNGRPTAMSRG